MRPGTSTLLSSLFPAKAVGPLVLEIDLDRGILKATPENPLQALRAINSPTLGVLAEALRKAAGDPRVKGLVVHIGTCPVSAATVDELVEVITLFGRSKPTVAYAESFGELSSGMFAYRLAIAANQVWLQPSGALGLGGVHVDMLLLRGGLEKLGIEPEFAQRKEYKTAAEVYGGKEISQANREMSQRLAQSLAESTVKAVSQRRHLDEQAVWDAVNSGPMTAQAALDRGFVDKIGYRDEVYGAIRAEWGDDVALQYAARYSGSLATRALEKLTSSQRPTVAVVSAHGGIVQGRGAPVTPMSGRQAASEVVSEHLRQAAKSDTVKAVVLSVDSGGGSYIASDTIRRAVLQVRQAGKPVVATMGDVAASGGYFVAMGADEIVANPSTLTGSIGVLAGKMVTQGLFDKLGVTRDDVKAGANADFLTGNRPFSEEQWRILDAWLDDVYADFTAKAAHDRGMAIEELEPLARGRVWTGADAFERKLVDHLGGRDLAVDRACALAGLDRERVSVRPLPLLGLLERLQPAESSEQPGGLDAAVTDLTPEGLLAGLAARLGLAPSGVLSVPYRIRLG